MAVRGLAAATREASRRSGLSCAGSLSALSAGHKDWWRVQRSVDEHTPWYERARVATKQHGSRREPGRERHVAANTSNLIQRHHPRSSCRLTLRCTGLGPASCHLAGAILLGVRAQAGELGAVRQLQSQSIGHPHRVSSLIRLRECSTSLAWVRVGEFVSCRSHVRSRRLHALRFPLCRLNQLSIGPSALVRWRVFWLAG